jgi:hypothetical protein
LVIHLNDGSDMAIDVDRNFTFPTALAAGSTYQVGVRTQPAGQVCAVSSGSSGTMPAAAYSGIVVTCTALPPANPATFAVGGTVGGLNGTGLILQLNGGTSTIVTANGPFAFSTLLADRTAYQVTIQSQPAGQQCGVISGGTGGVNGAPVNDVSVVCTTPAPPSTPTYTVGGTANGLLHSGLVLQLNGSVELAVPVNQPFQFPNGLTQGSAYVVTVKTQPPGQLCTPGANSTGTIGSADVTSILVTCTTPPPPPPATHSIRGTLVGLTGTGLVLRLGAEQVSLTAGATSFAFPTALVEGSPYSVEITGQPSGQTCTPSSSSGVIGQTDVTSVVITCVTPPPPPPTTGLTLDKTSVAFEAEEGQSSVVPQVINGALTNVTGRIFVRIAYTDQGVQYAVFDELSPTTGRLTIAPKQPTRLPQGTIKDTVTVTACFDDPCTRHVNGSPKVVNISYIVKANSPQAVLKVSDHGIAFASVTGAAHLTRTLTVRETSGTATTFTWSASANAAWLSVTPSGNSGGALVVTADASSLASGFHEALVTVTSSNPAISEPEIVRVGLYKSTSARASALTDPLVTDYYDLAATRFAPDPVRPLFYSAAGSKISAHHAYTGARTGLLEIPGADIGDIALSDNGRRLYALNRVNRQIVVVDLDTFTVLRSYGFPQLLAWNIQKTRIVYAVVNGQAVLAMSYANAPFRNTERGIAPVFKAETGEILGELYFSYPWEHTRLAVSRDGSVIYVADGDLSGILSTQRVELRSNSLGNVYGKATAETEGVGAASLADFATNEIGSRVLVLYFTSNYVMEAVFDGTSLRWTAGLAPSINSFNSAGDIEIDPYGRVFTRIGVDDLRLYRPDGSLAQQWTNLLTPHVGSGPSGSMRISSDGLRLMGNGKLIDIPQ